VALLVDSRRAGGAGIGVSHAATGRGRAEEAVEADRAAGAAALGARHPELGELLARADCAVIRVAVRWWEVVRGLGEVSVVAF
jgi:hypothetical protein